MNADVYDTLEFMALAFGGIGAGNDFEFTISNSYYGYDYSCPICVHGLARAAGYDDPHYESPDENEINAELDRLGISRIENDRGVRTLLTIGKGSTKTDRVTWKQYTKYFNIVREEQLAA